MPFASNDPESLTDPLAIEVRRQHNVMACLRGWPQFPPGVEEEFFAKVVWSVLLGLDQTEFRLVHVDQLPDEVTTVHDQLEAASKERRHTKRSGEAETGLSEIAPGAHVKAADMVNHPPHYTSHPSGVECIQIAEHMGFSLGNAMKYIWRADEKGSAVEDLEKARWYLDREIAKRKSK